MLFWDAKEGKELYRWDCPRGRIRSLVKILTYQLISVDIDTLRLGKHVCVVANENFDDITTFNVISTPIALSCILALTNIISDLETQKWVSTFNGHSDVVTGIKIAREDESMILTCGRDGLIMISVNSVVFF